MTPGFAAYFKRWIDDQEKAWKEEELDIDRYTVDGTLAVLACAEGPLKPDDLARLVHKVHGGRHILSAHHLLDPLRRFVVGDRRAEGGYVLSHPRIGSHLRTSYLLAETVQRTQEGFVAWGRETIISLSTGRLSAEKAPSYLLQYHTEHLKKVGAPAEDFRVLVENCWRRAWEALEGGFQGFSRDVQLAWDRLRDTADNDPERLKQPGIGVGGQIRCALCQSSIRNIGLNVPSNLLAELVRHDLLSNKQALHLANLKTGNHKINALAALVPHLTDAERPAVLADALEAAMAIGDEGRRADALAVLAPHLTGKPLGDALAAAMAIRDEGSRVRALAALVPYLTDAERPAVLADALEAAVAIGDKGRRADALAVLAPHLTDAAERPAVLADALAAAMAIRDEWRRADALAVLAPHLTGKPLADALAAAMAIGNGPRADALAALAPHLTGKPFADALEAAMAIGNEWRRADALAALAPHLTGRPLADALEAAMAIGNEGCRARTLAALAPHLTGKPLADALEAAMAIGNEGRRARALAALAPYLTGKPLADALAAAMAIGNEWRRADALAALAPHLTDAERPAVLADALEAAMAIGDEGPRARALATLAPHLTGKPLADALEAAMAIGDEGHQARALAALVPYLTDLQRRDALNTMFEAFARSSSRLPVLKFLKVVASALPDIGDTAPNEATEAIRETAAWWP